MSRPQPPMPQPKEMEPSTSSGVAYATPIYSKDADDNLDEFDDLTIEELRSLLDNFKNLSKSEQMDLIRYMRKLEHSDPEKVKLLKQTVKPGQQNPGTR